MQDFIIIGTATLTPFVAQLDLTPLPDCTAVGALGLVVWYFVKKLDMKLDSVEKATAEIERRTGAIEQKTNTLLNIAQDKNK